VKTFHAWIDGGFIAKTGGFSFDQMAQQVKPATALDLHPAPNGRSAVFNHILAYLVAQQAKVEPLYALEKQGKLAPEGTPEGRAFIENQILVGGNMLANLWLTAWREAPPDTYLRASLLEKKLKTDAKQK
jgi:hypothetical protein